MWRAACKTVSAFRLSYRIAWTDGGYEEGCNKHSGSGGFPGGCFSLRMSNVDREYDSPLSVVMGMRSLSFRTPPDVLRER